MKQLILDLRAETRGWAEIAGGCDKKLDHASDFLKQIHIDQRAMKETLDRHEVRLDSIDTRLDGIDTRMDGMDAKLTEHGDLLHQILAKLG